MPLSVFADGRLFGERRGDGSPQILALHGWGRDRSDFRQMLEGLDAIALDLPGFGASPLPTTAWGSAEYADAIRPVLDEFEDPPIVVGHSFGGRVAVTLAAANPAAIRALILTGVPLVRRPGARRSPSSRYRLLRWLYRRGLVTEKRMEAARQRHGSIDYQRASSVMRSVLVRTVNEDYSGQLPMLDCPVDLVWGEHDTVVPVRIAHQAAGIIKGSTVTICPGADHISCLTEAGVLRSVIRKYYRQWPC